VNLTTKCASTDPRLFDLQSNDDDSSPPQQGACGTPRRAHRLTASADGGLSGASLERPALQGLLEQVRSRKIDMIVVYKVVA